jgi:hypothetical protein
MIPVPLPLGQNTAEGQSNPNLNQNVNENIIKTGISGISCLISIDTYMTWYPRYD